jgi:hypothetical protein
MILKNGVDLGLMLYAKRKTSIKANEFKFYKKDCNPLTLFSLCQKNTAMPDCMYLLFWFHQAVLVFRWRGLFVENSVGQTSFL